MLKHMSRWSLGLLIALLLTLALTACGDATSTPGSVTTAASTTAAPTATKVSPTTTAAITTSAATTASSPTTTAAMTTAATTAVLTTAATTTSSATTAAATTSVVTTGATTTGPPTTTKAAAGGAVTITDDAKRNLTFDKTPTKIVSLAPSNTELLFALGVGSQIVGVDDYSDYPAEASKIEKIGGYNTTNLEKVVSLSPDLVVAAEITDPKLIMALEDRQLKVVVLHPLNLAGIVTDMKLLGQILNVPDAGAAVSADFQKRLDAVSAKIKGAGSPTPPRIFYELDPTLYTVAPGSFIDDMIQKAGGQNIVTDNSNPFPQLNQEAVISKDPQVILLGDDSGGTDSPDKILTRPGWEGIAAVKNKRIVAINANLVNRPGPRAAQGVEVIAKALYPDLFK